MIGTGRLMYSENDSESEEKVHNIILNRESPYPYVEDFLFVAHQKEAAVLILNE